MITLMLYCKTENEVNKWNILIQCRMMFNFYCLELEVSNLPTLQGWQLCFNLEVTVYRQGIWDFKFPTSACQVLTWVLKKMQC
jgi:hypothetical protein